MHILCIAAVLHCVFITVWTRTTVYNLKKTFIRENQPPARSLIRGLKRKGKKERKKTRVYLAPARVSLNPEKRKIFRRIGSRSANMIRPGSAKWKHSLTPNLPTDPSLAPSAFLSLSFFFLNNCRHSLGSVMWSCLDEICQTAPWVIRLSAPDLSAIKDIWLKGSDLPWQRLQFAAVRKGLIVAEI